MSKYKLHQSVIDNLETLRKSNNPLSEQLIIAVKKFAEYTPIDFGIIKNGGYRTSKEQNEIFKSKPHVTNCDGYNNKSYHQSGLAVDLVPWVDGAYTWDEKHTTGLSMAFKTFCNMEGLKIVSGADWDDDGDLNELFYDPCHFEIRK